MGTLIFWSIVCRGNNQVVLYAGPFLRVVRDMQVVRALSEVAGVHLPYESLSEIRGRMTELAPHLTRYGEREEASSFMAPPKDLPALSSQQPLHPRLLTLRDFYMTDAISRASPTMARCMQAVDQQASRPY